MSSTSIIILLKLTKKTTMKGFSVLIPQCYIAELYQKALGIFPMHRQDIKVYKMCICLFASRILKKLKAYTWQKQINTAWYITFYLEVLHVVMCYVMFFWKQKHYRHKKNTQQGYDFEFQRLFYWMFSVLICQRVVAKIKRWWGRNSCIYKHICTHSHIHTHTHTILSSSEAMLPSGKGAQW